MGLIDHAATLLTVGWLFLYLLIYLFIPLRMTGVLIIANSSEFSHIFLAIIFFTEDDDDPARSAESPSFFSKIIKVFTEECLVRPHLFCSCFSQ